MNPVLGNRLYWYLMVEVALEDRVMAKMYGRVVFKFMNKILEVCDLAACLQTTILISFLV
jgi:phosphatidylinositol 3-kinase